MNNRFKFRIPMFTDKGTFTEFQYIELGDEIECTLCGYNGEPQQCTGLKDKNDTLIYEGDIIKNPSWWWGNCYIYLHRGECGPCKGDSVMSYILCKNIETSLECAYYNIWNGKEVEVIGNIYENKELLECGEE